MAAMVFTSTYIALNATDLSAYCKKAELVVEVDEQETTNFASSGWKAYTGGLKAGTLAITANDSFTTGEIDAIMWPLLGTVVAFEVRPTSASVGVSNPKWTGSVLITSHKAGGDVGALAEKDYSFPTSGAVTRATS
jgi:hypothetical protein